MQRRSLSTSRRAIQPRKCTGAPRALLTCHCEERSDVAISQNTAESQGTPGEYGNFTRRGVEDAAPYKECVVGDNTRKFAAAKGTP